MESIRRRAADRDPEASEGPPGLAGPVLRARFLGGCEVFDAAGESVHLESAKTAALLAYLVVARGVHPRATLVGLLWPDLPEERAAAALRRALWDLKRKLAPSGAAGPLLVSRASVGIDPGVALDSDVTRFVAAVREAPRATAGPGTGVDDLEAAAALYRGDLLAGLVVEDAPLFEDWLVGERERVRLLAVQALRRLVAARRAEGEAARALAHARELLVLDPWLEEAHRTLAELLALTGRRGAAIRQLEACRRVLADELGTAPSRETVDLERRLKSGGGGPVLPEASAAPSPLARTPLPLAATPFVGRQRELEAVAERLLDPACRLLTILGPGGAGKTRLALQAASRLAARAETGGPLADGVVFLSPVEGPPDGLLAPALTRALGLPAAGFDDVPERLLAALSDRRLLLVLDGFEHRLAEVPLLVRLLAAAPEVKALVTSRERLRATPEWVLPLAGLETPGPCETGDPARSPAVQLFLASARRASLGFTATGAALAPIVAICRALDGLPLGVELAASWVNALPPAEVAAQVARGLDFLRSPLRDAPDGPRSLRAVFDQAYGRLDAEAQRVLRALSVFRGGMTWEAAVAVAGAAAETLRVLADRAFLHLDATTGRYAVHEVLRSFAGAELAARPDERAAAELSHAHAVAAILSELKAAVCERREPEALEALSVELENVRAAWQRAVARTDVDTVDALLPVLSAALEAWGAFREGERLADEAVGLRRPAEAEGPERLAAVRALVTRGAFRVHLGSVSAAEDDLTGALDRLGGADGGLEAEAFLHRGQGALVLGRFAAAHEDLGRAISLARRHGAGRVLADALGRLGRSVLDEGRHEEARGLFAESLATARALGNQPAAVYAVTELGFVDYFAGEIDGAERRFGEARALARRGGDRPAQAAALQGFGFVAEDRGELEEAAARYREALALCRDVGDRHGTARALMLLGEVERKRGASAVARRLYGEALGVADDVGSAYLRGLLEGNLAYLAAADGRLDACRRHLGAALAAYRETGSVNLALPVLIAAAEVAQKAGESARAVELLGHVSAHPGNRRDHREEVDRVLSGIRRAAPSLDVAALLAAGARRTFEELTAEVEAGLASTGV